MNTINCRYIILCFTFLMLFQGVVTAQVVNNTTTRGMASYGVGGIGQTRVSNFARYSTGVNHATSLQSYANPISKPNKQYGLPTSSLSRNYRVESKRHGLYVNYKPSSQGLRSLSRQSGKSKSSLARSLPTNPFKVNSLSSRRPKGALYNIGVGALPKKQLSFLNSKRFGKSLKLSKFSKMNHIKDLNMVKQSNSSRSYIK